VASELENMEGKIESRNWSRKILRSTQQPTLHRSLSAVTQLTAWRLRSVRLFSYLRLRLI